MPETLNLNFLLTGRRHKGVSLEVKVLYGLLLDRMSIDCLAMPGIDRDTAQREGELVTLQNGSWEIKQALLEAIMKGNERTVEFPILR